MLNVVGNNASEDSGGIDGIISSSGGGGGGLSAGLGGGLGTGLGGVGNLNNINHHQTMFFGPAQTFSQYNSLPRRGANVANSFQRNTPIRRSIGIPEHHMEFFVPRSISEFNLSGVGDLALPPPRRYSPNGNGAGAGVAGMAIGVGGLPHGLHLGPLQTLVCSPPPPPQLQLMAMKPREKMVTFEDESKSMQATVATVTGVPPSISGPGVSVGVGTSVVGAGQVVTHCPHGVPTTPRKTSTTGLLGASGEDIFM